MQAGLMSFLPGLMSTAAACSHTRAHTMHFLWSAIT
jgi:hypothetical protein